MRERLVTLAGALLALVIVYGLFFADGSAPLPTRPTTAETGPNGLYALHEWLASSGVATLSLRERYRVLVEHADIPSSTGNVMITALPWQLAPRDNELAQLKAWIDQGNTLLVLASLNDTSDWSVATPGNLINELHSLTGIWFYAVREDPGDDESEFVALFGNEQGTDTYTVLPRGKHPLLENVSRLEAESDLVTSVWQGRHYDGELVLELATMQLTDTPAIWQRRQGAGQIVVVGSGTMMSNRALARADNRELIRNLVATHLDEGGRMIFDDMHQGLSALYDPNAFYADSRLHNTIWFVLGFWLIYVVGSSNRLLGPRADAPALRQTDFVDAVGAFISKHSAHADTGLWLYRSWFNDVRRHLRLPVNGEPVWDELSELRTLDPALLATLRRQHARLASGSAANLVTVHNTIRQARQAVG